MALERGLDDASLHAVAAPVDQAENLEAGRVSGANVLVHDRRNVVRRKRVQIELGPDWHDMGRVIHLRDTRRTFSPGLTV
jgi:hypothetical protein